MPTKVNHIKNIISEKITFVGGFSPGDILKFKYTSENTFDKTPLVFVLPEAGSSKTGRKKKIKKLVGIDIIFGINLNYLTDRIITKLLAEQDLWKLKQYQLYKKFLRSYSVDKAKSIKIVKYKTNNILLEEKTEQKKNIGDVWKRIDKTWAGKNGSGMIQGYVREIDARKWASDEV